MQLNIPDFSLVVLIGGTGSGKSTFAAKHFSPTEILSSDRCRALVADDENDQRATGDAFEVLYTIAAKRLASRRLTAIDATNLRREDRAKGIELARRFHALPVAIVFDVPPETAAARNATRADRSFGARVVYEHAQLLRRSIRGLQREGYRVVHVLDPEQIDDSAFVRNPLYTDKRDLRGPFDIIGDVHGCHTELVDLLEHLGYARESFRNDMTFRHPHGRCAVFVGDLVDRGPAVVDTLRLVMGMVAAGNALCVPGNHENKLVRKLKGRDVKVSHGLEETLAQFDALPENERADFTAAVRSFLDGLVSHYWLDGGKLVVAHAGLREEMHGRGSPQVREFALYGETTGETDEYGLPVRFNWAAEYRGKAVVAYGHTPVEQAEWLNNTICLDTGCVYGGSLTALRYPERELVSVPARRAYAAAVRPLKQPQPSSEPNAQQRADETLDIDDVAGKRRVATRFGPLVLIPYENAAAALEIMSRYCVDPRWLIYLPPTMSPSETSRRDDVLEHPDEAFAYYRRVGVNRVVLEEKHMGSRAVIVIAQSADAATRRFGVARGSGVVVTRTGRAFFNGSESGLGETLLTRIRSALDATAFWDRFETDWACFDAELLPWSLKAQGLIDEQYAPTGEAAVAALDAAATALQAASARGVDASNLEKHVAVRRDAALRYAQAYRRYMRPIRGIEDVTLAPFHLLATEGNVYDQEQHEWHLSTLAEISAADPALFLATASRTVALDDPASCDAAIAWWEDLTNRGGEGIVVKPPTFVTRDTRGLVQPALKVRGREYLRIVYGPEYTLPENMSRLRERAVAKKRRSALAQFALGLEGLHRFVERAPIRRIHECVFGILALESEPIDSRL